MEGEDDEEECAWDIDCFEFEFPIEITLPGEDPQSISDEEELEDIIEDWYDNNPDSDENPTITFPIQIIDENGETLTIDSQDAFDALVETCTTDQQSGNDLSNLFFYFL